MSLGRKRRFLPEELSSIDAITRAVKRLHTSSPSVSSFAESTQAQSTGSMHAQSGLQETSMTQEADSMGGPTSHEVEQPVAEPPRRMRLRNDSPLPPSPCGSFSRHLASRAAQWRSQNRLRRSIGSMGLPEREPSNASSMSPSPSGASEGLGGHLQDSCASPSWQPSEAHTSGVNSPCQATAAGPLQDGGPVGGYPPAAASTHFRAPAPRGLGPSAGGHPLGGGAPTPSLLSSMGSPPPRSREPAGDWPASSYETGTPSCYRHAGRTLGRSPSMVAEQYTMWEPEGVGGADEWPLTNGQVEPQLPQGPRHEVDMAQVAVARLVGRQQIGDEDAAASARLELLNALDDLDMGPQPAASSAPTRFRRQPPLSRHPSINLAANPLHRSATTGITPFNPLLGPAGGQHPSAHPQGVLPAGDALGKTTHSALDHLPSLPDRRHSMRRCSSLRDPIEPIPFDPPAPDSFAARHHGSRPVDGSRAPRRLQQAAAADLPLEEVACSIGDPLQADQEDMNMASAGSKEEVGQEPLGDLLPAGLHMVSESGLPSRDSASGPGGGQVGEHSAGLQMPSTPEQTCSEDGSPPQRRENRGETSRNYATVYEEANHLLRNLHFERIRRTKRSWQWDL